MKAVPTIQAENELTRVTEWRFAPGAATGYHRHEHDYVVVPMTTGNLRLSGPDVEDIGALVAGRSYFRRAGVEHDVVNANDHEFVQSSRSSSRRPAPSRARTARVIPTGINQNPCAHFRRPIDMIFHG